jgi:hypothetical protein
MAASFLLREAVSYQPSALSREYRKLIADSCKLIAAFLQNKKAAPAKWGVRLNT